MPPGTGDAALTLTQQAPLSGAVIVTTANDLSLIAARKGLKMFETVQVPALGIIGHYIGTIPGGMPSRSGRRSPGRLRSIPWASSGRTTQRIRSSRRESSASGTRTSRQLAEGARTPWYQTMLARGSRWKRGPRRAQRRYTRRRV
jgi:hypothetical protein